MSYDDGYGRRLDMIGDGEWEEMGNAQAGYGNDQCKNG